jgi:hypothetical protein
LSGRPDFYGKDFKEIRTVPILVNFNEVAIGAVQTAILIKNEKFGLLPMYDLKRFQGSSGRICTHVQIRRRGGSGNAAYDETP